MTVRWGFLGAGWIAQRAMAPAVHAAGNARLQAAASRDASRTAALEPRSAHASYEAVIADPGVDAVYVSLANHQHEEWAVRALAAGKHVLCEKPLAVTAEQAGRMARAARAADRLLVEAVWCRWHPRYRRLVDLAASGALGELVSIDSGFTFPGDINGSYRARPELGGGALLDVGGYQVQGWVAMTDGASSPHVTHVQRSLAGSGIDLTTKVAASIGSGRATAVCSFVMPEHQYLVVTGTDAVARMGEGAAFTTWREPSTLVVGDREEAFAPVDAYQLMVEAVSDRIDGGPGWCVPIEDTLAVAGIVDAIAAHS